MEMTITTGCDEEGNLTAFKAEIIADTGAYASLGGPVLQRGVYSCSWTIQVPKCGDKRYSSIH